MNRHITGTAVVTGAAQGTGLAIARRLAEYGARVVLTGHDPARLDQAAKDLNNRGWAALARECEISDRQSMEELADFAAEQHDLIAWVNNAGINGLKSFDDLELSDMQHMADVNVAGCFLGTRAAASRMSAGASIVNISSISAQMAFPDNAHYGATKGTIESFTRHAALDLGPRNIRVNAVAPGSIRTAMTAARLADPAAVARRLERIPLGRIGEPEDIAGPVAFLCSPEAAYITGAVLVVDGGRTIT